jgi:hypothetical protein
MDVHALSNLNGERSFGIINALIAGKDKELCQVLDSRLTANNEASKKLKKIQRADHFIFEERGSNDLHIGWPFVRGKFADGTLVRCPLLFFPVKLVQQNNRWILQLRKGVGITTNKSFLLAYAFYNKIKIEEELLEANFEDFSSDSTVFRTEVYQLLKEKLEVNFNADNFRDELINFEEFKKDPFDEAQRNGEIKLYPEAVLGIFPQAGSHLVPDYIHLIEKGDVTELEDLFSKHKAGDTLIQSPLAIDHLVKEEKLFTPITLDAYQERAVKAIKNGHSIVVQGPPGTGKSQLICNLISDAIASGKRALLVCQKRAALDVVYHRMKETDLADFLGLVHDFQDDRNEIFAKVARQIDRIDDFKARNRSIDAIQLERKFFQVCRRTDQLVEEFEDFRKALFNDQECGLPVKELYLTSALHDESINIKQEYHYFNFRELDKFIRTLRTYAGYALSFEAEDYPWHERRSFSQFTFPDLKEIQKVIEDVPFYHRVVADQVEKLISSRLAMDDLHSFYAREGDVMGVISVLKDTDTYHYFQRMSDETDDETSLLWLTNTERVLMNCFDDEGPESTVPTNQLGQVQQALQQRMFARKNLIKKIKWEFFSENKFLLKRILVANTLDYNKLDLAKLEKRIDNRLNYEHHLTSLKSKPWLTEFPSDYKKDSFKKWFDKQKLAIRAKLAFSYMREIRGSIDVKKYSRSEFIYLLRELLQAVKGIPERKLEWFKYLSPYQVRQLLQEPDLVKPYIVSLKRDFDDLVEFDRLKDGLQNYERDVIVKLHDHVDGWEGTKIESCFQNSLRLAWIDHIETKYPVLRSASSLKMGEMEAELQECVSEKKKLSREILLMRARDRVFENIEFNRLNNRITYRDLYHQVTKKKKKWPVRKVISEFRNELFNLVPCWMASPESVSAIFPMEELFDLVIFDEASQCFAERGIPAIARGKQILVAGDNMQLRPSELYQVRWNEEGDDPDQEVDSLLELSERYLSTVHLQGHYRSHSMELIDFSNEHFYGGRLRLLPDKHTINKQQTAIEYCKVDGIWEDNTNEIEATTIVEKVLALLSQSPEKEIGIVTFNASQQTLILDLLEERFTQAGIAFPESLFVKNIENVQGDEKDIIIFSVAYAPDKKNKIMMQFGSLNQAGGENRLNVAITRAREKIILVTSIWPEQLNVDSIKNDGPKLLRKYLEFARRVDQRNFKPHVNHANDQTPAWYLNSKIKQWGEESFTGVLFEPDTLPFSDLNFKAGQRYLGVILTDDMRYFTSLSAKDNHAYTPALLSNKNWSHRMVFSRNYWQNKEKVQDELMSFIGMLKP